MGNAIKILLLENIMSKLYAIKTVYHGTTSNYTEQILRRINIKRGSPWADFGQGFYTTSSFIYKH